MDCLAGVTSRDVGKARDLIEAARRIVVLTGAGVSAESGVPTFRGPGGLWKSFRAEELATPQAFARDPALVWEWYAWRRGLIADCDPNPAHDALAGLALRRAGEVSLITQNVDGLHHRAARATAERLTAGGSQTAPEAAYPLEVHGALHRDRCSRCERRSPGVRDVDLTSEETLPRCEPCGAMLRPDVVWFGEALDPEVIGAAFAAAGEADLCLVVGTSALVYPAASVPDNTAQAGGRVVEVNLEATGISGRADFVLLGPAGELMPLLIA